MRCIIVFFWVTQQRGVTYQFRCEHHFLSQNDYLSFEHLVKHLREFADDASMAVEKLFINVHDDITIRVCFASLTGVQDHRKRYATILNSSLLIKERPTST